MGEKIDVDSLAKRALRFRRIDINTICDWSFPEAVAYTIQRFSLSDSVDDLLWKWHSMVVYAYGHKIPPECR